MEVTITSSIVDDTSLTSATMLAFDNIREKYIFKLKNGCDICVEESKRLFYDDIRDSLIENKKISVGKADSYFGSGSSIVSDAPIIYLVNSKDGRKKKYPLFIGEIKKQGTNDERMAKGLKKQAIGNAGSDRIWKNYMIFAEYCNCIDSNFFPYIVFLHGCDFSPLTMDKSTIGKIYPLFGNINTMNPFFDNEMRGFHGGCCYCQKDTFNIGALYDIIYECCEIGIKYYIDKYKYGNK